MQQVKLGAQLYTLRDYIQTYADTEETFAYLQSIGINVIQISGIGPIENEKVAHLVEKYEMDVCVTHTSYERMREDTQTVIEEHKRLGCNTIGIGSMPGDARKSVASLENFLRETDSIGSKLKQAGMRLAYHNHAFEFCRMEDGRTMMDRLIYDTEPEHLYFTLDSYWLQYGGVNPVEYINKVAGRMRVFHFKDYKMTDDGPTFAEVGTGNLNLDACYCACRDTGVGYIVIEQDRCEIDPRESMAISYRNLKEIASRNA